MPRKFKCSIYAKESGLQISAETRETGEDASPLREGRIQLRFFLLQPPTPDKTTQIKFILEPFEAYDLYLKITRVCREGGKDKLVHKFRNSQGEEIVTNLLVEAWSRGDREGYGFAIGRGDDFISVPISKECVSRFLHAAEVLRYLSTSQQWVEEPSRPS